MKQLDTMHLRHYIRQLVAIVLILIPALLLGQSQLPVASFTFVNSSYEMGEAIEVRDQSYSSADSKITKREWKAKVNGTWKSASTVKSLLASASPGEIEVYLRVRDASNTWSNWVSQKVTLVAPVPIQITQFYSEKSLYTIGEKLQLKVVYDNPNELEITGQRWRYRNVTSGAATVSSRPKYFRKAGTYEITLEVQDERGNWSNKASCTVTVSNEVTSRDGYYLFEKGTPGDLIDGYIDNDYNSFAKAQVIDVTDVPGTLILSNSPESIPSSGILYRDTVEGIGRILVHHLNATAYGKKLLILAEPAEANGVNLTISHKAIEGPHKNILSTGQDALVSYLKGTSTQNYTMNQGQLTCIYDSSKIKEWSPEEVISGTLDFNTTGQVTFYIVAMDVNAPLDRVSELRILPRSVHKRGTFNVIERRYTLDLNSITQPVKLVLGKEQEEWLQGTDALTGETIWNQGNYGLPIKISITNNEAIGVILNARGGGYLGAMRWGKASVFRVPNETVLTSQKVAALVGCIKAGMDNEMTYMLPNGSAAPVLLGFVPQSLWK